MPDDRIADEAAKLAALFPAPVYVKFGPFDWPITPMTARQSAHFLAHVRPIMHSLFEAGKATPGDTDSMELIVPPLMDFLATNPEEFFAAMAIATGQSANLIGELPTGVVAGIVTTVVLVNHAFFVESLGSLASGNVATPSTGADAKTPPAVGPTQSIS